MTYSLKSTAVSANPHFVEAPRVRREDNLQWLMRQADEMRPWDDHSYLVLLGGADVLSLRLRMAQAHLRHDMSPSYWSHCLLWRPRGDKPERSAVFEISLAAPSGLDFPPVTNGLQEGMLGRYRNARAYPNLALVKLPVRRERIAESIEEFKKQRATLDCVELLVRWLGFAWGVAGSPNPLHDGYGLPGAAWLEAVFTFNDIDLTPGLESHRSCPEAIWQSVKWWHEYYRDLHCPIEGVFTLGKTTV